MLTLRTCPICGQSIPPDRERCARCELGIVSFEALKGLYPKDSGGGQVRTSRGGSRITFEISVHPEVTEQMNHILEGSTYARSPYVALALEVLATILTGRGVKQAAQKIEAVTGDALVPFYAAELAHEIQGHRERNHPPAGWGEARRPKTC